MPTTCNQDQIYEPIEESLMTLRKHIFDFVTNPLFESRACSTLSKAERRDAILIGLSNSAGALRKVGTN
jgi:hypothetical protein